jgi:hypothetical protein
MIGCWVSAERRSTQKSVNKKAGRTRKVVRPAFTRFITP